MTSPFSDKVIEILERSRQEAQRLACREITPEHILLGILNVDSQTVANIFEEYMINPGGLKDELENRIQVNHFAVYDSDEEIPYTEASNMLLRRAITEARNNHQESVGAEHLLLAILNSDGTSEARKVLEGFDIHYDTLKTYLSGIDNAPAVDGYSIPDEDDFDDLDHDDDLFGANKPSSSDGNKKKQATSTANKHPKRKTPFLDKFSHDLTKAASDGKLDPVVGRDREIMRVIEILGRRKKNNPILIGEPGVGKSAIVEGLAQLINKQQVSPTLYNKRVVDLDMTAIVAGTKYRGQFEERIKGLINELEENPDIIIFIDEIHTIIGAGSAQGTMDAANILKPALARGTIQCIGATTLDEYRNSIEKDGALERRFQKVIINPTTPEETLQILHNIKDRYEQHHTVSYSDEALEACVKLTDRYVTDRFFPDKAIDVLDEVGSRTHISHASVPQPILELQENIEKVKAKKQLAVSSQNFELAASYRDQQTQMEDELETMRDSWENSGDERRIPVDATYVAEVVSSMTGIPVQRMAEAEGIRLKNMANVLKSNVIAQDNAIEKIVKAIQRNRIGLKDPNHPIGAFMFLGPTGVGKTYLAKKLAEEMFGSSDALIRVDMSEYSEGFNTSRLVGAPPGYVGYEEGGQLTEKVRRKPYSIVLLDEIEKASGKIFNLLLQVLDEGRLTDGNGRFIDFRNTIIIMTSNAGTRQLKEFSRGVGFNASGLGKKFMDEKDKEYARSIIQKSLSKQFAPEFLNRLDEIITFDQLDLEAIKKIIDLELKNLFKRVKDLGYDIQISDKAKEFVASKGYDIQFGARPLKRAIQTYIEDGVCELLISGKLEKGATISIGKSPNKDELTFK